MLAFIYLASYLSCWLLPNPLANGISLSVTPKTEVQVDANEAGWIQFSVLITYENLKGGSFDFSIKKHVVKGTHHVFSTRILPEGNLSVTPNATNDARWSWKKKIEISEVDGCGNGRKLRMAPMSGTKSPGNEGITEPRKPDLIEMMLERGNMLDRKSVV